MEDITVKELEGTIHGSPYLLKGDRLFAVIQREGNMQAVAQYFNDKGKGERGWGWRLIDITLEFQQKTAMQEPFWEKQGKEFRGDDTLSLGPRERWLYFVLMNRADAFLKSFVAHR
jgi:hypothetical protein